MEGSTETTAALRPSTIGSWRRRDPQSFGPSWNYSFDVEQAVVVEQDNEAVAFVAVVVEERVVVFEEGIAAVIDIAVVEGIAVEIEIVDAVAVAEEIADGIAARTVAVAETVLAVFS